MHPEALTALVLMTTTSAADRSLISRRIRDDTAADGFRAALLRHFPGWFLPTSDHELAEWVCSEMLRTPEHVALRLVDDYADVDLRPGLPRIQVPTLVIGATGDESTPPLMSEEIARLVPNATLAVVESAGHFVQLERPEEVNRALLEFLSG
jgi:pimeloyl-ACP methyl ester carboxylesterase